MVAQKGRLLLIKVESAPGSGTFIRVGGLRTKGVKINNEMFDASNDDSEGRRKLLEGAGINSIEASGSGIVVDSQGFDILRDHAENNTHPNLQVVVPGENYSRVYEGRFGVQDLEQSGEYNGAVTFSVTLPSDGDLTMTRIDDEDES